MQVFRPILAVGAFCSVVMELSIVVGAICENVGTDSLSSAMIEVPNIVRAIFLVHPPEYMRFMRILSGNKITSSKVPT